VPNDSAAERWHTRLVAAWDHWQRRGHWMTDTTAPHVNVDAPFSVTETQVHTLQAGEGPVVADTAISVNLCEVPVLSPPATVRGLRHLHRCSGSLVGQHPRGRHDWCLMDPRFPPEPIAELSLLSSARMCVATC
jgi:hypothetical protein